MLNREEEGVARRVEARAAHFGTDRHPEEQLRGAAPSPSVLHGPDTVRAPRVLFVVAIGRDPKTAIGVDGAIVRMPNQPFLVVAVEKEAPTSATLGSPHFRRTSQRDFVEAKSPSVSEISTMWPKAFFGARIGGVDLVLLALRVVGQPSQ